MTCEQDARLALDRGVSLEADDLGGWPATCTGLVERLWRTEIEPHLNLEPAPRLLGPEE